ncbi:MAG: hypothetical protein WC777_03380 [Candidatus Gracilibacteria bacterium]|jgi:hypothetical protein
MAMEGPNYDDPIEQDKQHALNQIRTIGPEKPVGYLPVETITGYCGQNFDVFVAECRQRGHETRIFTGGGWPGFSGSLYVYDKVSLQNLLNRNQSILEQSGWPLNPDEFVANLHVWVQEGTPIFKLIAQAFGDKFSESL